MWSGYGIISPIPMFRQVFGVDQNLSIFKACLHGVFVPKFQKVSTLQSVMKRQTWKNDGTLLVTGKMNRSHSEKDTDSLYKKKVVTKTSRELNSGSVCPIYKCPLKQKFLSFTFFYCNTFRIFVTVSINVVSKKSFNKKRN